DDNELVALLASADHALGDVDDVPRRGHRGAAVLLDDARHHASPAPEPSTTAPRALIAHTRASARSPRAEAASRIAPAMSSAFSPANAAMADPPPERYTPYAPASRAA